MRNKIETYQIKSRSKNRPGKSKVNYEKSTHWKMSFRSIFDKK